FLEDLSDEWLYRCAVGTRWCFPENADVAGWELGREATYEMPLSCDDARAMVGAHVRSTLGPLGGREDTIGAWVDEVLRPWQRVLGAHLTTRPFLFGARPSLADFALFGGNAAHFASDPVCRRWLEADAPAVVAHTHRLLAPEREALGDWDADVPGTLVECVADAGRLYLPWVSRATREGAAEVAFASGARVRIATPPFLRAARATLLAPCVGRRGRALDAVPPRGGVPRGFADGVAGAGPLPVYAPPPRPALTRPFPPA